MNHTDKLSLLMLHCQLHVEVLVQLHANYHCHIIAGRVYGSIEKNRKILNNTIISAKVVLSLHTIASIYQFLKVGDALRVGKPAPPNKLPKVEPLLDALSEDKERRLNEISSVIVVAEAGDDFPQHTVQGILNLPNEKRKLLKQLVSAHIEFGLRRTP